MILFGWWTRFPALVIRDRTLAKIFTWTFFIKIWKGCLCCLSQYNLFLFVTSENKSASISCRMSELFAARKIKSNYNGCGQSKAPVWTLSAVFLESVLHQTTASSTAIKDVYSKERRDSRDNDETASQGPVSRLNEWERATAISWRTRNREKISC